jgi:predicted nucleotidyltransferase component of viral defense system
MRRSRDQFEAAREEFQRARAEFTNTLDVWSSKERLRDGDYDKKLTIHRETLQKLGTQHVDKALEEAISSMSEMVWPLASSEKKKKLTGLIVLI